MVESLQPVSDEELQDFIDQLLVPDKRPQLQQGDSVKDCLLSTKESFHELLNLQA